MALSSNVRGRWGLWNEAKVGEGTETGVAVRQCPRRKLGGGCGLESNGERGHRW